MTGFQAAQPKAAPPKSGDTHAGTKKPHNSKHACDGVDLWTDGLLCAYEYVPSHRKHFRVGGKLDDKSGLLEGKFDADLTLKSGNLDEAGPLLKHSAEHAALDEFPRPTNGRLGSAGPSQGAAQVANQSGKPIDEISSAGKDDKNVTKSIDGGRWIPIGWKRLAELAQAAKVGADLLSSSSEESLYGDDSELVCVADVAAPFWVPRAGPTWWCNVLAGHPHINSWLTGAQWLHPAVRDALRDENRLISERMKHLYYEVPVRVAGGLLFELLGQSVGDPQNNEDDIPVVLRSWQAQNFLVTALHVKGKVNQLNVLGILEVQDFLGAGGVEAPKLVHEVIAHLANRLARWDNRLFRKHFFGAADEVELKFVNRQGSEDLALLSIILNQEIKRLSYQVIRVKWSLHAREEIIFELSQHLKGKNTLDILSLTRQGTRDMIDEQESVRDRLFTVQDVMQNTVRSFLQDKSVRITHNLTVFGGCGLVLSIITGLFGINVDGIPGSSSAPYTFLIFALCLLCLGCILVGFGFLYLGLHKPVSDSQLLARKLELQEMVKSFQHAAETHAKVRDLGSSSVSGSKEQGLHVDLDDFDYVMIT